MKIGRPQDPRETENSSADKESRSLSMCLECGKCSASCPRMLTGKEYSPRLLAHKLIAEPDNESFIENSVWECLTCGLCEERCPSGVQVRQFIMEMRTLLAGTKGLKGYRSHDGALHSWMRLMTSPRPGTEPARLAGDRPTGGQVRSSWLFSPDVRPISTSSFPGSR